MTGTQHSHPAPSDTSKDSPNVVLSPSSQQQLLALHPRWTASTPDATTATGTSYPRPSSSSFWSDTRAIPVSTLSPTVNPSSPSTASPNSSSSSPTELPLPVDNNSPSTAAEAALLLLRCTPTQPTTATGLLPVNLPTASRPRWLTVSLSLSRGTPLRWARRATSSFTSGHLVRPLPSLAVHLCHPSPSCLNRELILHRKRPV
jgi:hypothetical protein